MILKIYLFFACEKDNILWHSASDCLQKSQTNYLLFAVQLPEDEGGGQVKTASHYKKSKSSASEVL